jgi:hypothetical protein
MLDSVAALPATITENRALACRRASRVLARSGIRIRVRVSCRRPFRARTACGRAIQGSRPLLSSLWSLEHNMNQWPSSQAIPETSARKRALGYKIEDSRNLSGLCDRRGQFDRFDDRGALILRLGVRHRRALGDWKEPTAGEWLRTFAIITIDANELVADIHDRMP